MDNQEMLILDGRVTQMERRLDAFERPCEEGMSREHLQFHWKYSEGVAAQLGEIRSKLLLLEEKIDRLMAIEDKLDKIIFFLQNMKEA